MRAGDAQSGGSVEEGLIEIHPDRTSDDICDVVRTGDLRTVIQWLQDMGHFQRDRGSGVPLDFCIDVHDWAALCRALGIVTK